MKLNKFNLLAGILMCVLLLPGCGDSESETGTSADSKKSMIQWQFYEKESDRQKTMLVGTISENVLNLSLIYKKEAYIAILEGTDLDENNQIKRNIQFKRYYDTYNNPSMMQKHNALSGTIVLDLSQDTPSVSYDLVSEIDNVELKKSSTYSWSGHADEGLPVTLKELDISPKRKKDKFVYKGDGRFFIFDESTGCTLTATARETSYRTRSKDNLYMGGSGHIFDFKILPENTNCAVGDDKAGTIKISFSKKYTDISISAPMKNFHVTYGGQVKHF